MNRKELKEREQALREKIQQAKLEAEAAEQRYLEAQQAKEEMYAEKQRVEASMDGKDNNLTEIMHRLRQKEQECLVKQEYIN